ncbi:signal peptidase I [Sphingobacterium zeae]|uniref:Signal peptidase I n=1 Tax=Sphingobacterium zeae TaxID=1776859 RepID=A0ABU0U8D9_9SPHI|nr:signal peptidase I [Sphingobacterium zeae]MDQ1151236.1 signal peptidase I [Sphingobacterium zeae]
MNKKKHSIVLGLFVVFACIIISILYSRIDYYIVSTESMLPTIKPGNYILVKVFNHDSDPINDNYLLKSRILVIKKPVTEDTVISKGAALDVFVKRCHGIPGDTIRISRKDLVHKVSNLRDQFNKNIFPHDSTIRWSATQFGPLWVPKKGSTILLNAKNIVLYSSIMRYEGASFIQNRGKYFLNGKYVDHYTFKNNYYFFLGDNFYSSEDSRFWGLVPEINLIGKVIKII